MDKSLQTLDERNSIINNVQICSIKTAIQEGPTYICDICWKFEFRRSVIKLKKLKYQTDIYNQCSTIKSDWICKSCHSSMLKNKMPIEAQLTKMELYPKFTELDRPFPFELMLLSQIIAFMSIVSKTKGAQHGLKGQFFLVQIDLKKIQTILPRSCDEEYLIFLALKRRLTDKSVVNK